MKRPRIVRHCNLVEHQSNIEVNDCRQPALSLLCFSHRLESWLLMDCTVDEMEDACVGIKEKQMQRKTLHRQGSARDPMKAALVWVDNTVPTIHREIVWLGRQKIVRS